MKNTSVFVILPFVVLMIIFTGCKSMASDASKKASNTTLTSGTHESPKPSPDHIAGLIVKGNSLVVAENTSIQSGEENSESGACQWLLQIDSDPSVLLDPMNLAEEFQQGNLKVWVLFSGMRRMNRCPEANPVWVQDIILR